MKLVLFILHDAGKLSDLLNAWREAGATGATVLASTGMGRLQPDGSLRDDLPLMPSLGDFYAHEEDLSRTVFTLVKDEATVDRIRKATRQVIGDLQEPNSGLLIVLPVDSADGFKKRR